MPTTNPRTQVAEEPEPTLRDVLVAVNGLGTRLANVESDVGTLKSDVGVLKSDVGSLKFEMAALTEYTRTQFTQQSLEIANLRSDVGEMRVDLTSLVQSHAAMVPLVYESLELGRSNRDVLRSLKEDVAALTAAAEGHHGDHEIHVPRARSADGPLAGPMAA